jgi:hypothetical protein
MDVLRAGGAIMQLLWALAVVGALAVAGCVGGEKPLVSGGPTPTQAISAILDNARIISREQAAAVGDKVRLDATECAKHPNAVVTCRVRIYSIGRGWSAPAMGRFTQVDGRWVFDF